MKLAIILLLLVSGCTHELLPYERDVELVELAEEPGDHLLDVRLDTSLSDANKVAVWEALQSWREASGGRIGYHLTLGDLKSGKAPPANVITVYPDVQMVTFGVEYGRTIGTEVKLTEMSENVRMEVAAHELGHAMGLQHSDHGIMVPSPVGSGRPTAEDAAKIE